MWEMISMTKELFKRIIDTAQDCVFWKDKDRRFLGVNQAFLDYYGFDSADALIGKTDEDMGWHSDPEPFMQDELRVLQGESTYKVQGKCMMRGEERDIIASKRPLYDGDQIVGLVGSFSDITNVLRKDSSLEGFQQIYSLEELRRYSYFDKIIDEISLEEILDPLTGILSRTYALKFVNSLIREGTPFSFTLLDLDNFKSINDTYGHEAGDQVLQRVAEGITKVLGADGVVGRFGGDELLIIDPAHIEKEEQKDFFERLYRDSGILRTEMAFEEGSAYISGTAGCAAFPSDADNFGDLFGLMDKMLYLGKSRGRNCYTLFDKLQHSDIQIAKLSEVSFLSAMQQIRLLAESRETFEDKLRAVMPSLFLALQISDLYYVRKDGRMKAAMDPSFDEEAGDIFSGVNADLFSENSLDKIEKNAPVFYGALQKHGLEQALIARIRTGAEISGYLICAVTRSHRIWQENESAILYYLAGLLAESK